MSGASVRVLLVEDNSADARLLQEYLTEAEGGPYRIQRTTTLAEGITALAEKDVVLLDLSLPDAHGLETAQRMLTAAPELPIVILTGQADEALGSQAVKAGAQDYLYKGDLSPALIGRSLRYAIERKKAEENGRRLLAEQVARTKADEAARRAEFLVEVSAAMLASLQAEEAAQRLARSLLPALGDACIIDLAGGSSGLTRIAVAALRPEHEGVLRELHPVLPCETPDQSPARTAERDMKTVRLDRIDEQQIASLVPASMVQTVLSVLHPRSALLVPMVLRGALVGTMTLISTERERAYDGETMALAEDVARRAALAFENVRLYEAARTAVRSRDEVLAIVSHDLRNPLNVFGITLSALRRKLDGSADGPGLLNVLTAADRSYQRMNRLLTDLLDVSRIDQGKLPLEKHPTDVSEFLTEVVDLQRPIAAAKDISIVLRSLTQLVLPFDRERMAQLMGNLLSNAVKFTPAGGCILVEADHECDHVSISVQDSGPGIPPDHLPHVFDRFWQQNGKRRDGIGLGLAIAKGIIEAHSGQIRVLSEPGQGARFELRLPVRKDDVNAAEPSPPPLAPNNTASP